MHRPAPQVRSTRLKHRAAALFIGFLVLFGSSLQASGPQPFSARYQINFGDIKLGDAYYRFNRTGEDSYLFDFNSHLRFLIFSDRRNVSTTLNFTEPRLMPLHYIHDREGTGKDYVEEVNFSAEDGLIRSRVEEETTEFDYDEAIVDGLTVQLQLMLDLQRGVEEPRYKILDDNRVRERTFRYVGTETLTIENAETETVIYEIVRDNNRRSTRMWFSTERDYLPVQMVHSTKGKKRFNAFLLQYSEQPDAIQATP